MVTRKKINLGLKLVFIVLLFVAFMPAHTLLGGQVTISGQQTRGRGSNAKLYSKPVKLSKNSKIVAVSGNNQGFWITSSRGVIVAKYWTQNDKRAIGVTLKKGTYYIYPNLKRGQNKANVTIRLQ